MSTTTGPAPLERRRSAVADTTFRAVSLGAGLLVLVLLAMIAVSTTREAWPAFRAEGLGFVTSSRWAPNEGKFGSLAFVYGTMVVSAVALTFAVPVSIGIALFITEVASPRVRRIATFGIDLLAAVPSVVFGLWGLNVLVKAAPGFYGDVGGPASSIPIVGELFSGTPNGKSFMTAGLILGLMVTPIITSITREVFATTPAVQKEAAIALGATRWEMLRASVFPHSRGGVIGAVLLGLGRAMGETIAAALVIGSGSQITAHLFGSGDAMAARIANEFGEASGTWRSALIGLGVVLFVLTILVNLAARSIVVRAERRAA